MSKTLITLFVIMLTSFFLCGQHNTEKVGEIINQNITSKYLNEERSLEIYLPPGYQQSETKRYPVMYVMDGQEYFLHPIAYQRMLRFKDKSPEFIVVGVNSDRKKRRKLYYEDASKIISFLMNELIPLVDTGYRTLKEKERIYFGWEMAGGLGLDICTQYPGDFNAFFISSPTHFTEDRFAALDSILTMKSGIGKTYLHFSKAPEEVYIEKSLKMMDSMLRNKNVSGISWQIDKLKNEDHYTTSLKTINNGLRNHFGDYDTLRFYSLKEYDEFGDLEKIKKYYLHRGERYGISTVVHRTTQHFLLYNAMKENKFERFEVYANEFKEYFQNPRLEVWPVRFGNYYASNNKETEALEVYEAGLKKFPESSAIYHAMGMFFKNKSKNQEAKNYFKKAVDYALKSNDPQLGKYKTDLEQL